MLKKLSAQAIYHQPQSQGGYFEHWSTLAQVMVCCLMALLPEPMLTLRSCGLLKTISKEKLKTSILDMSLKIINWRLHLYHPWANELTRALKCEWWIMRKEICSYLFGTANDLGWSAGLVHPRFHGDKWMLGEARCHLTLILECCQCPQQAQGEKDH